MPSALRHGAIVLALVGAGVVAAHQSGLRPAPDTIVATMAPTTDEATGSIGHLARPGSIALSDEQLGFIFLGVMNLTDVPEADVPAPGPADALPATIELQEMPAMVTRQIPLVRDHKFVKIDDRILVVRAGDRVVVAEIPRYRLLL